MQLSSYSCEMVDFRHTLAVLMPLLYPSSALAQDGKAPLPAWSYDGDEDNQDKWGTLSPAYAACELGNSQSPIDIAHTTAADLPPLVPRYANSKATLVNTGRGLEIRMGGNNTLMDGKTRYRLTRIQFHTPGEHTLEGKFYLVEIQFIHRNANGNVLILAVSAASGEASPGLQAVLEHVPAKRGGMSDIRINPADLIPPNLTSYYAYTGSLSSPPCTEGVEWRVLKQITTLSSQQLALIGRTTGRNARLTQPVYMRIVKETR